MQKQGEGGWPLPKTCACCPKPVRKGGGLRLTRGLAFLLLTLSLGVAACTNQDSCLLFNGTDAGITVVRAQRQSGERTVFQVGSNESVLIDAWAFGDYEIRSGDKSWMYSSRLPPVDFVTDRGWGPWARRVFQAQLNRDGRVFLLSPTQTAPVTEPVPQPEGFPLLPR